MNAPPAPAAWQTTSPGIPAGPPCQHGIQCSDRDDILVNWHRHRGECAMSQPSKVRRAARVDSLTWDEKDKLLNFLVSWTATGTDIALADADATRDAVVLQPGDMPEGAL